MKQFYHTKFASKPPMGWNSWDCFCVSVTEEEVKANADFVAKNLKHLGWEYIIVDLAWYASGADHHTYKNQNIDQNIDEYGRLIPCTTKFPSSKDGKGFKPLADYVHGLGLKFGIHIMRGIPVQAVNAKTKVLGTNLTADQISYDRERCPWYNSLHTLDFSKKGAQEYYDSIFKLYESWDVDYIKADDLNSWHEVNNSDGSPTGNGSPYRVDDIEGIRNAIDITGRPMVLSLSPGGPETTLINHLRKTSNLWRISADFWDEWGSFLKQMDRCATWAPFIAEGHWPDADMLPLGYMPRGESGGQERWTNFNHNEQYSLMTLWCIFKSPLMFGGNLPQCDPFTIDLISNIEVLNVNQYGKNPSQVFKDEKVTIWKSTNPDDSINIALFNKSEDKQTVKIKISELGLSDIKSYKLRDLWGKKDKENIIEYLTDEIEPHGAGFYKIS